MFVFNSFSYIFINSDNLLISRGRRSCNMKFNREIIKISINNCSPKNETLIIR